MEDGIGQMVSMPLMKKLDYRRQVPEKGKGDSGAGNGKPKQGRPISEAEARILDNWADEYGVPQHHKAYPGSGAHFKGGTMSHFIFGCFNADVVTPEQTEELKKMAQKKDILIWFDNEIDFYADILKMTKEQGGEGRCLFALTSRNQPSNSDDLLFPYDKYTNEQLFEDKTREYFLQCCKDNLETLFWCLQVMVQDLNPKLFQVFVTEGYDCDFMKKCMNLDEMKSDIQQQVLTSFSIDSCIYQIEIKN